MPPPAKSRKKAGDSVAKKRPGVILYFDTKPAIKSLNAEQKASLLDAILEYGESGESPDFHDDPILQLTWSFVYPRIDKDGEAYMEKSEKARYAVYCREAEKKGIQAISYDAWREFSKDEQKRLLL